MNADSKVCGRMPESDFVELAVEIFGMLADATRVRLILALREAGELSVNDLAEMVDKGLFVMESVGGPRGVAAVR